MALHPEELIAFISLDPTQAGWQGEMEEGRSDLTLKGIKLMPMYGWLPPRLSRPGSPLAVRTHAPAPCLLHTGTTFIDRAPLECTPPRLLDNVAIRFPKVKIVLAHLGVCAFAQGILLRTPVATFNSYRFLETPS